MKKILLLLCTLMILSLCACRTAHADASRTDAPDSDTQTDESGKEPISPEQGTEPETPVQNKAIVVYFSATGNTKAIAEHIAGITGADLYEIVPTQPYTEADLRYYTDCRADREQKDPSCRPEIAGDKTNIGQYDVVFLGYPIWHGQAPKILYTFLESYDLSGKTIVPFCTSGSSGVGSSAANMKPCAPSAVWLDGTRLASDADKAAIEKWLDGLNLPLNMDNERKDRVMKITIGDTILSADFAANSSAEAFAQMLSRGDVTVRMSDYGNFEKVGDLPQSLPRNDEQITTEPGDIILYLGKSVTIYYDTNSWNFTRLGKIRDITQSQLKAILGSGDVTVTFSLG